MMRLTRFPCRGRQRQRSFRMDRRPVKNWSTHTADTPWAITVARAAPFTPMSSRKIKMGSSTMLMTAPMTTVNIPVFPNPWALIKGFIPRPIMTNRVPHR